VEIRAVVEALQTFLENIHAWISTDSAYVKRGITEWIRIWLKSNWKNSRKATVSNKTLWQTLLEMVRKHRRVEWSWVKDILATRGAVKDRCPPPVQYLVPITEDTDNTEYAIRDGRTRYKPIGNKMGHSNRRTCGRMVTISNHRSCCQTRNGNLGAIRGTNHRRTRKQRMQTSAHGHSRIVIRW
jgi:hypothetical protein